MYCQPCGYHERAEDLASELREQLDAKVTVEEGGFGQFDVLLNGTLVASKGGLIKRMLKHGPPSEQLVRDAINRALADRKGDFCKIEPR